MACFPPTDVFGQHPLGTRPGAAPSQAHHVTTAPPPPTTSLAPQWDQAALIQALNAISLQSSAQGNADWIMDTGASSHMSSGAGNLHSLLPSSTSSSHIIVGNGASLPVTHNATTTISTTSRALHLSNILVAPHIIKNLLSVRALTRDNSVSVMNLIQMVSLLRVFRPRW